jgi:hypothetical protein
MAKMPRFKHGEHVGVMRGPHTGRVGIIVKVGILTVAIQFPGVEGLPVVPKDDLIRILRGYVDGDGTSV